MLSMAHALIPPQQALLRWIPLAVLCHCLKSECIVPDSSLPICPLACASGSWRLTECCGQGDIS